MDIPPGTSGDGKESTPKNLLSRIIKTAVTSVSSSSLSSLVNGEQLRPSSPAQTNRLTLPRLKTGHLLLEVHGAQRQWESFLFILVGADASNLALYYYRDSSDSTPVGSIHLHSASIDLMEEIFCVITFEQTWFLCAENQSEAEDWADTICGVLDSAANGSPLTSPSHPSGRRRRLSSHVTASTVKEIQTRDPSTRIDEFIEIYLRSTSEEIRNQAAKGAFSWSSLRSVTWRLWLGCLPISSCIGNWIDLTNQNRQRYEQLVAAHPFDISALFEDDFNDTNHHIAYAIFKDVRRTRSTMHFFREQHVQKMLISILYIYSQEHPHVSYNQGMGELLAAIVYLLHVEKWPEQDGSLVVDEEDVLDDHVDTFDDDSYVHVDMIDIETSIMDTSTLFQSQPFHIRRGKCTPACREAIGDLLCTITDGKYIEHDAYALFEQLMIRMATTYSPTPSPETDYSNVLSTSMTALQHQLDRIHSRLLPLVDSNLAIHLNAMHLTPEVYLLRWVRLLLAREFQMYQVWVIWDAIFGLSPDDFNFVDILCVAILYDHREEILAQEDPSGVLHVLKGLTLSHGKLVECGRKLHQKILCIEAMEVAEFS